MFVFQKEPYLTREKLLVSTRMSERPIYLGFDEIDPGHPAVKARLAPMGSVEFTRAYARAAGVALPVDMSYPTSLDDHLHRVIRPDTFANASLTDFVKPRGSIKSFTGAIKADLRERVEASAPVWVSNRVFFLAEWRVYVLDGAIVGHARYDPHEEHHDLDTAPVRAMIRAYCEGPCAYALDVGLLENTVALVEVNDAWALGFYGHGTLEPKDYVKMILSRWNQLVSSSKGDD